MFPDKLKREGGGGNGAATENREGEQPEGLQADDDSRMPEQADALSNGWRGQLRGLKDGHDEKDIEYGQSAHFLIGGYFGKSSKISPKGL
jgi:hypothetical protein